MAAELHVLSGERAGLVIALTGAECTVGRHPDSALRFGAEAEQGVSARHALLLREGTGWRLRDLGSTNGTWLNGRRVRDDAALRDGDRVAFGAAGPVVEFRHPDAVTALASAPAVRKRARRIGVRAVPAVAAACALLAGGAGAYHLARSDASADEAAPVEHQGGDAVARLDAPSAPRAPSAASPAPATAPGSSATPAAPARPAALRPRTRDTGRAGTRPAAQPAGQPAVVGIPTSALAAAPPAAAEPAVQAPQAVAVERRNRLAVARIYVEGEDGEIATGTAFAVRGDGTLITSRHVVGAGQRRIAVQFAGSSQVWHARVVAVSAEWDLAAVRVEGIVGDVPTVRGLNLRADTLAPGTPVMLVGFPRGSEPAEGTLPRASLAPAAFAAVRGGRVELYARSATGASGSPVFDANGQVVAVLFGGNPRADRPVLYAVPASAIAQLIAGR